MRYKEFMIYPRPNMSRTYRELMHWNLDCLINGDILRAIKLRRIAYSMEIRKKPWIQFFFGVS